VAGVSAALSFSFPPASPGNAGSHAPILVALRGDTTGEPTGSPHPAVQDSAAFINLLQLFLAPSTAAHGAHAEAEGSRGDVLRSDGAGSTSRYLPNNSAGIPRSSRATKPATGSAQAPARVSDQIADAMILEMLVSDRNVAALRETNASPGKGDRLEQTAIETLPPTGQNKRRGSAGTAKLDGAQLAIGMSAIAAVPPLAIIAARRNVSDITADSGSTTSSTRRLDNSDSTRSSETGNQTIHASLLKTNTKGSPLPFAFGALLTPGPQEDQTAEPTGSQTSVHAESQKLKATPALLTADPHKRNTPDQTSSPPGDTQTAALLPASVNVDTTPTSEAVSHSATPSSPQPGQSQEPVAEPKANASVGSKQEIAVRVDPADGSRIDLHLRQRQGEIQVAVRASDAWLSTDLQRHLPELVQALDQAGYHAKTFTGAAQFDLAATHNRSVSEVSQSASGDRFGSEARSGSESTPDPDQQGGNTNGRRERSHADWLEQMEA
jgi:hypothetical protein